jgi:2-polyprenyl-3-methyl-5-hydroxy-6-metoxy-1,4-benzoquinol methylase
MDAITIKYYDDNADSVFAMYSSLNGGVEKYCRLAFPPGSEILDIGSGSGRDVNLLINEQYEAYGAEPSCKMRSLTLSKMPQLQGRIYSGALPDLAEQIGRKFDGILCSAVFQHIPEEQQFDAAFDIRNLLKPNGRLLMSFPTSRPGLDDAGRDENGRLFTKLVPAAVILLFERLGFRCIGDWDDNDGLGRPGIIWKTLLFSLHSDQVLRPIDQIEGVLNRDRKVATYKPALFRALCDIALTNYHLGVWRQDGTVGIPIQDIAERWIYYYWPILEDNSFFIPQIRGESSVGRIHLGFRPQLGRLIDSFRRSGGLDGFAIALRNNSFSEAQRELLKEAFRKLIAVIKEGPMTHAGCSSKAGKMFEYDTENRHMIVGGDIWRELCLSGHWIQDALILRWSELTSEISKKTVSPSQVVDRLLRIPTFKRSVDDAKRVYLSLPSKECVWSGISINRTFDVDHVLPFSLWRNNDLWNLLPAAPSVNRNKGDSIPTNALLKRRRDTILTYWEAMHQASPRRFELEANRLTAASGFDLTKTFGVMVEAVEVTALQRGCLRWEP